MMAAMAAVLALILLVSGAAWSQVAPPPPTAARVFSDQELDQMLAPIALYPDPLLGQILTAATYPLEVVEADRWLQVPANAALTGAPLAAALQQQNWDPSVKSLVPFPQILRMMDDNLDWTEELGDAFLAQQQAVMDAVQRLRQKAEASGALSSTPQQTVTSENGAIEIEPTNPETVYIPAYNPELVYGEWLWPEYPPYLLYPWPEFTIGFGIGIPIIYPLWGWCQWNWGEHRLNIDIGRYNAINAGRPPVTSAIWQHDVAHRHDVPYRDAGTAQRFEGHGAAAPEATRIFRGYGVATPPSAHAPPPAFESFGRGAEVRGEAARGAASRATAPAPRGGFGGGIRGGVGGGIRGGVGGGIGGRR